MLKKYDKTIGKYFQTNRVVIVNTRFLNKETKTPLRKYVIRITIILNAIEQEEVNPFLDLPLFY